MGDYAQLNTEKLNFGNLQRHHLHQSISGRRNQIITGERAIDSLWTSSEVNQEARWQNIIQSAQEDILRIANYLYE